MISIGARYSFPTSSAQGIEETRSSDKATLVIRLFGAYRTTRAEWSDLDGLKGLEISRA